MTLAAFVRFPGAPLTESLVRAALDNLDPSIIVLETPPSTQARLLQWCSYDHLDHELVHNRPDSVLGSSYTIRKSLIRKHYLHRTISSYVVKRPNSVLAAAVPRTWDIDIAWADELDDMFTDELWDLAEMLDSASGNWFILKASMADRGNGIRLFNSKESLRTIFDEYDERSDVESDNEQEIMTSQLRHFVIQELLSQPLLVDPAQALVDTATSNTHPLPYKFHLRAYCIASGALALYLWPHILALFAAAPYSTPSHDENGAVELAPHLTNTSLQTDRGEAGVRLLSELASCSILSEPGDCVLSESDIRDITNQTADILAETFKAALASPVHFQALPNVFELFGADLLVTHVMPMVGKQGSSRFQVHLLELNAEPAIELTGPRLRWILEDMFKAVAKVCVGPFFNLPGCKWTDWKVGETREGLKKCLGEYVRGGESSSSST